MKLKSDNVGVDVFERPTDYEEWERKDQRKTLIIDAISCIVAFAILIALVIITGFVSDAKMKYVGRLTCTTYHVSDNTPRGTRATSTGHRAEEWRTIAVDWRDPAFKMGEKIYVEGFGWGIIEDVGNLAANGAHLDLFTPEGVGFKEGRKVWRCETKKEKATRLRRKRERAERRARLLREERQQGVFVLTYDPSLAPWQIVTDPEYIAGGTVQIGWAFYDVVGTEKGLQNVIKIGQRQAYFGIRTHLNEVWEEAVG